MTNYNFLVFFSFFGVLLYFVSSDSVNGTVNIKDLQDSTVFETNSTARSTTCDCGHFSYECRYTLEGKSCTCYIGYAQTNVTKTGVCKECSCGVNSALCRFEENIQMCKCPPFYIEKYGSCHQECDCGANSLTCRRDDFGYKKCTCEEGYLVEKSILGDEFCKSCDCGPYSKDCRYTFMGKSCTCYMGYAQTNESRTAVCKECNCGINSISCEFEKNIRKCKCIQGYLEKYGSCQECDCGENSRNCKRDVFGNKKCTCEEGYAVAKGMFGGDESCKKCDCGLGASSCSIDQFGFKKCTCRNGYLVPDKFSNLGDESCKRCDCGPAAYNCKISKIGTKTCSCNYNYEDISGTCLLKGRNAMAISGWKIGTIAISVIYSGIIIALLYKIVRKRGNSILQ